MATCRAPSSLVSGDYLGVTLAHVLKEARDGMDEAIALAQHDPAATRQQENDTYWKWRNTVGKRKMTNIIKPCGHRTCR